jgi:2-dehydro-3-deoxyphosphogluconate aldolase/(4S)-4-hydroxy-2-oxoglutarate aldolase
LTGRALPGLIHEQRVIAIARRLTPETAVPLAEALSRGGLGVLEVTVEEEGGIPALAELTSSGLVVGAGTITSVDQAAAAVEAGASFLVSPHLDARLIRWSLDSGVPFVPGALTPTEVHAAWAGGASVVKIFPASVGGPDHIAALKGPLPQVDLIPTGGIDGANAAAYLDAGALAVGVGGWLTGHRDMVLVSERAAVLADAVRVV